MSKKAIWTAKHPDGGWQVKREGADKATSIHSTQAAANKAARQIAINNSCEHKIQGRDGKIINSNSYGNDPCPPRDKK
jgi:hypothetical protein